MGMCEVILKIGAENMPVYATDKFVLAGELFSENRLPEGSIGQTGGLPQKENKRNFTRSDQN